MTRKDYILIASALRDAYNTSPSGVLDTYRASVFIANNLEIDNPKFDLEHFLAVVRGEKDANSKPERNLYDLIPDCVSFDPMQIKTLADVQYILQHEIDLAEEGEDGALSGTDLKAVRKAFTEVRNSR